MDTHRLHNVNLRAFEPRVSFTLCDFVFSWGLVLFEMALAVDAKLLKQTKFPPEFNRKVDMTKVNVEVMKKLADFPGSMIPPRSSTNDVPLQMDCRSNL